MPKDKKRKLPFQIDKFQAHTFHYYSPPNIKNNDLYNFNESKTSPFSFLKSSSPSSQIQLPSFSILSTSSSTPSEQSMYLLNSFEKTINSLDKESFKKQKVENDKMFKELNNNRIEINNSFNHFQKLNNNLFDNINKDNISINNLLNNDHSGNNSLYFKNKFIFEIDSDQEIQSDEIDELFSFIDEQDVISSSINRYNNEALTNFDSLDLSFLSPSNSTSINTSTAVSPSVNSTTFSTQTTTSTSNSSNINQLESTLNSCQFLYDGDLFDEVSDN